MFKTDPLLGSLLTWPVCAPERFLRFPEAKLNEAARFAAWSAVAGNPAMEIIRTMRRRASATVQKKAATIYKQPVLANFARRTRRAFPDVFGEERRILCDFRLDCRWQEEQMAGSCFRLQDEKNTTLRAARSEHV